MYLDKEFSKYKYIVQYSDNYILLYDKSYVIADYDEPTTIKCLVKYINDDELYFYTTKTFYQDFDFQVLENINNDLIFTNTGFQAGILAFIFIILLLKLINIPTRTIKRGGIFNV